MWNGRTEPLADFRGLRCTITFDSRPASFAEVIQAWQSEASFRSFFNALLADSPSLAFRWETPPVTADTLSRSFEFVLLDSPQLDRRPNPEPFAGYFAKAETGIATFASLGRDSLLIAPCPLAEPFRYVHLATFVRRAPESQRHALWQAVGEAMTRCVGVKPVWLNTAGAGVSWLHVRLDHRPKYYRFMEYTHMA